MSRRWLRAALIALSVGLGVATLVATQALNWTMARAAVFASNPTSGFADFIVANGELPVPLSLGKELGGIPGVAAAEPRIFANAFAPQLGDRAVLVLGVDAVSALKQQTTPQHPIQIGDDTKAKFAALYAFSKVPFVGGPPVTLVGRELFKSLPAETTLIKLRRSKASAAKDYALAGPVDATGNAAAIAGFVAMMDINDAARLFELPAGQVHRFDITLKPGADPDKARDDIEKVLNGRALVRTFAEQSQNTQNVMAGMQTGFSLCGLAALIVGLFLVYNALSVTVTERRHEIGVLRAVGATRGQILGLFAGEALLLGFLGSLLGIPIGLALASLGLKPMQDVLSDVFFAVDARQVYLPWVLYAIAISAGMTTTLLASLVPAFRASHETPADAVRKVLKAASVQSLVLHIVASALFVAVGAVIILSRHRLPQHWGSLGGMCFALIGALLASPFFSGLIARILQPFVRRSLGIEWRLAADNIVRSPGRTGLVIGALAAGVSLVVLTAGIICSNREAARTWLDDYIAADLLVTSGSPVGAGGQTQPMSAELIDEVRRFDGVEAVMPVRVRKIPFHGTQVMMLACDAGVLYSAEKPRKKKVKEIELFKEMDETPHSILISENMAILHGIGKGDILKIPSPGGEVHFKIIGTIVDVSWNHGTMFVHRRDYLDSWYDTQADVIDVYMKPGSDVESLKSTLLARYGATHGLFALTRGDLQAHVNRMVEKIYSVAYAQLIVVMLVAGLGVVMALLIAVLQRQHEMGLLRAVGASRNQVIATVLAEACLMGIIGTVIGVIVGIPLEWYVLNVVMFEEAGMLFPIVFPWKEALFVSIGALTTAILAGLGPAIYAVRQRIPDTIAYE